MNVKIYDIKTDTKNPSPYDSEVNLQMKICYEDEDALFEALVKRTYRYEGDEDYFDEEVVWYELDDGHLTEAITMVNKKTGEDILTSRNKEEFEALICDNLNDISFNSPFFYNDANDMEDFANDLDSSIKESIKDGFIALKTSTNKSAKKKNTTLKM